MPSAYKYEVKEDEEQNVKLQETVELLVASGYFRARIKGLSPFDKVVGGMVWCVSVCSYEIDVDMLFQENATIGQKISMTEKIVEVLKEMKCPYIVEPHQIQGLDFIHIFPAVQWLVMKAIENKKGKEDYNRTFAVSTFNKFHTLPDDVTFRNKLDPAAAKLEELKFKPERKYQRKDRNLLNEEKLQVQSTLLEYGRNQPSAQLMGVSNKSTDVTEAQHVEEKKLDALMSGLSTAGASEDIIRPEFVNLIVGMQSEEINKIMLGYDDKVKQLQQRSSSSQMLTTKKSATVLNKQIEVLRNNLNILSEQRTSLVKDFENAETALNVLLKEEAELLVPLKDEDDSRTKRSLVELENLVVLNDELKKKEVEFKSNCLSEKKKLQEQIDRLYSGKESEEQIKEREKLLEDLNESFEKLKKLRLILGKKSREISALQRKIDDVPSREELHQYQCRFIELHNQVSSKHKETKQFFTLYNTLDDTRLYLNKEVDLLNSILDNFEKAMLSEPQKAAFMKQFEQIVEGVKQNKLKVERKKQEVKTNRGLLQDKLMEIIEKQRLYFKTVKDFQEECNKNEMIISKLQQFE